MTTVRHEFVEHVPDHIEDGVIYISIPFTTAVHRCACGCGQEVVTPLSPTDWKLTFDGQSISLYPSIGNWAFRCRSHYWIVNDQVQWAGAWSECQVEAGRAQDLAIKDRFYSRTAEEERPLRGVSEQVRSLKQGKPEDNIVAGGSLVASDLSAKQGSARGQVNELPRTTRSEATAAVRQEGARTRRTPEQISTVVESVLTYIKEHPALDVHAIADGLGLERKAVSHALKRLRAEQRVKTTGFWNKMRYSAG